MSEIDLIFFVQSPIVDSMGEVNPILLARSLDFLSDVVVIYDRHFKPIYRNTAGRELFKQLSDEETAYFKTVIESVFRSQAKITFCLEVGQGELTRTFETTYSPVLGDQKQAQFVVGISRDITELPSRHVA